MGKKRKRTDSTVWQLLVVYILFILMSCNNVVSQQEKAELPNQEETDGGSQCDKLIGNKLPCICQQNQEEGVDINCNGVSFPKGFPVLPHRHRIHSFTQKGSGVQSLEAQLFTASNLPLKTVDFSDNLLRRVTDRAFEGLEDTLLTLRLQGNRLGDQLRPALATAELRRLVALTFLDLSRNEIKALHSEIFTRMQNLQELHLEENELNEIPGPSLRNLNSLRSLHLQNNLISSVPEGAFSELSQLALLNLSSNDISSIGNRAFFPLRNLKTLVLSNNRIQTLTPEALQGLSRLESLDLSQNFIEVIPVTTLVQTPVLTHLILHSNKIKTIDASQMAELKSVQYLDLSRNRILGIAPNSFLGMVNLKELKLDVNSVRKITKEMFHGMEDLSDLSLNDNRILAFPTEPLTVFRKLRKLNLDYNRIAAVSREILSPVNSLEELSLAFNLISEIPNGTFKNFQNLQLLNLHGNKISDFTTGKTESIENTLLYLDISYNEISELPKMKFSKLLILSLAKNKISSINKEMFQELKEVRYLNMSYNSLLNLPPEVFDSMVNLERLDLQHNLISNIPYGTFRDLPLTKVNLRFNQLQAITENLFQNLRLLKVLDLSNNRLSSIEDNAFISSPNIEELYLTNNELTMFKGDFFPTKSKIKILDLSHNKINYLYPNTFSVHPNLKHLDLSYNGLTFFPSEIINPVHSLNAIILKGNKLQSVGDNYFSNMPNLQTVDLRDNIITLIGESAFQNSSSLHEVHLQNNKISFISENAFYGLNRLSLDLSNNRLSSLPNDVFSKSAGFKLESINLAMNQFRDFPTAALKRQYSFLEKGNFSFNKINNLPSNADVLVNVKELDLSYNPLSTDAHHVLFGEPKSVRKLYVAATGISSLPIIESPFIKVLSLKGNKLSGLDSNIFQRTNMLSVLDISQNEIPNLDNNLASVWSKLPRLSTVDLSHNPLRYISKSDFNHLTNLKKLRISNLSYVTEFDCTSLRNLPKLKMLSMAGFHSLPSLDTKTCLQFLNGLESLSIEIKETQLKDQLQFVYSPRLSQISVSGQSLRSVSSSAFAGMISPIIKITLTDTSISSFPDKVFLPLPISSKIEMDVTRNRIRRLAPDFLTLLDNKHIDVELKGLESNPITCDCQANNFVRWVKEKKSQAMMNRHPVVLSITELTCSEPVSLKGRKVDTLEPSDLVCDSSTETTTTSTTPLPPPPSTPKWTTVRHDRSDIIFEPPSTRRPLTPTVHQGTRVHSLTKVDTMIIGIVAGVVAFVCILVVVICIVRLRRARPHYTAGPLAGPLALRAQGKCTCLKPPPNSCTCYPMYPMVTGGAPPYATLGHMPFGTGSHHKMLPPPLPPHPSFLNTMTKNGRHRNTPYYVTYPDSDNDNR